MTKWTYGFCDYSGAKVRDDKMKVMWNGLKVKADLYDEKPKILDLQPAPTEQLVVNNPRPRPPVVFRTLTAADVQNQYNQQNNNS